MPQYSLYTDEELVCFISADDNAAFTELYNRYAGVLYLHGQKRLGDRDAAKDLIHDIFESVWTNRDTLQINGPVANYLYTALRYKIINFEVSRKRFATWEKVIGDVEKPDVNPTPDEAMITQELKQMIEAEVNRLPKKMREVFYMSRELQLSHQEIASHLELSPATVKKQVNNALKVLRLKFNHYLSLFLFVGFF